MNKEKQIKRLKKHNERLSKQLAQMKLKLECEQHTKDLRQTKPSDSHLETLKSNWSDTIDELKEQQTECQILIKDLRQLRNAMLSAKYPKSKRTMKTKPKLFI